MKKCIGYAVGTVVFLSTGWAAHAADLRRPPPPVAPVYAPVFSWTGFYVGGNLGWAWADADVTGNFTGANWGLNNDRFLIGGQLGYNYQIGNFVIGAEWDFDWADGSKSSGFVTTGLGPLQANVDGNWVTTIAARLGWAADRWLFYTKLGGGWTRTNLSVQNPAGFVVATGSNTNSGWLAGLGVEYAFTPNWTAKIEYNYLGLSDKTFVINTAPANSVTFSPDLQMLKVGFNYKF